MPINNVYDFILFVVPGFIASHIYYAHYPVKERSSLTQLAQSVIGSLLSVLAITWLDVSLLNGALRSSTSGMPDPAFALALLAAGVVLGYIAVGQLALRSTLAARFPHLAWLSSHPDSIWQFVNRPEFEDWAAVYIADGSIYLGWISRYRFDPDAEDQDFLLAKAARVDDMLKVIYPIEGIGVYLNTRDIRRIEFLKSNAHHTTSPDCELAA